MTPTCLTCGRPVEEGRTCCDQCLAPVVSAQAKVLRMKALTDALDRLEEAEKCIRQARAGLALALADLHE
jgi:predicted amidophosphoribosyltransferase